jgi:hypothetical protein
MVTDRKKDSGEHEKPGASRVRRMSILRTIGRMLRHATPSIQFQA